MPKLISLSNSKNQIIVDDEDYEYVSKYTWVESRRKYTSYAYAWLPDLKRHDYLHRLLVGGMVQVDHDNDNGLDNRRSNLILCSASQNCAKRRSRKFNKLGYRGVNKYGNKFRAILCFQSDGRRQRMAKNGFTTAEEAARAYNELAMAHFGDFAVLNEVH